MSATDAFMWVFWWLARAHPKVFLLSFTVIALQVGTLPVPFQMYIRAVDFTGTDTLQNSDTQIILCQPLPNVGFRD